ncbi:hypothetical protein ACIF8W_28850, partial [Streptomyces sp. NPDC085639]|uniref:hypothetical protein n=1 Tax=Streptomyces sp. NPDC085639 TaxID=3365734 RepID=UPI0037D0C5A5
MYFGRVFGGLHELVQGAGFAACGDFGFAVGAVGCDQDEGEEQDGEGEQGADEVLDGHAGVVVLGEQPGPQEAVRGESGEQGEDGDHDDEDLGGYLQRRRKDAVSSACRLPFGPLAHWQQRKRSLASGRGPGLPQKAVVRSAGPCRLPASSSRTGAARAAASRGLSP